MFLPRKYFTLLACKFAIISYACAVHAAALKADLFKQLAQYKFGQSHVILSTVEDQVRNALTHPEEKKEIARQLASLLTPETTYECKDFVCRQLALIGGPEEIPLLANLLKNPETADIARYALERIPAEAADEALLAALDSSEGKVKVGIINSLANRRCQNAATVLSKLATDKEEMIAVAAISGLGHMGNGDALKALQKLGRQVPENQKEAVQEAMLTCASGIENIRIATRVYQQMYRDKKAAAPLRANAMYCLAKRTPFPKNVSWILKAVDSEDPYQLAVARRAIREIPGHDVTEKLADALKKRDAGSKAFLIEALAARGDRAAWPAVKACLSDRDKEVCHAAVAAAGRLGDFTVAEQLLSVALNAEEPDRTTAFESIASLDDEKVNAWVLERIQAAGTPSKEKAVLLLIAGSRCLPNMIPLIKTFMLEKDPDLRSAAFSVLERIALRQDVPDLLGILQEQLTQEERGTVEKVIVQIAKSASDKEEVKRLVLQAQESAKEPDVQKSLQNIVGDL